MAVGPIQLLVVGLETLENARGEVLTELANLRGRGMIRVVDLLIVTKGEKGNLTAVELNDLLPDEKVEFGAVLGGLIGIGVKGESGPLAATESGALAAMAGLYGMSIEHVRALGESLAPGASVALLLFEHTWAIPLRDAIRRVGAYPIAQGFLTPEAVMMVGAELEAMAEAEVAIEVAETIKAAATLDALIAIAKSQVIQAQALAETEELLAATQAIKTAAIADAVRTLILADVIEQAAASEAIEALAAAGLIEADSLAAATGSANIVNEPAGQP